MESIGVMPRLFGWATLTTRGSRKVFALAILCITGGTILARSPADMPLKELQSVTQNLIAEGNLSKVGPYLDEIEIRFKKDPNPKIQAILQQFGFVRGVAYLQAFAESGDQANLSKAAKAFGFFAEKFPEDPKAVIALQKRSDCLRAIHEFIEAAKVIELLLDQSKPYRAQITKRSELLNLYYGRAQCYHIKQAWGKGEPAFKELLEIADKAKDEDRGAYAISCLTEMYVVNKRIREVFPLLPRLAADTPARYDLRLNVNLLQGGMELKEENKHVEASLFFALTMTTEEIEGYYKERSKQLKAEQSQLKTFLAAQGRGLPPRRAGILKDRVNDLAMKITNAQSHLKSVAKMKSYTTVLRWRRAENFQTTKRNWEAFWAFYWLYKDFPKHERVEKFIYAAFASANGVKHREKVIELGEEYVANVKWKDFRPDVTYILATVYREEAIAYRKKAEAATRADQVELNQKASDKAFENFFRLCDKFMEVMPSHNYAKSLVTLMGSTFFTQQRFDDLLVKFAGFENGRIDSSKGYINLPAFREGPAMGAANYFSGLALLASGRFEESKPYLEAVAGVKVRGLSVGVATSREPDPGSIEKLREIVERKETGVEDGTP